MRRNISPEEVDRKVKAGKIRKRTARRYYERLIASQLRHRAQKARKGNQEDNTREKKTNASD